MRTFLEPLALIFCSLLLCGVAGEIGFRGYYYFTGPDQESFAKQLEHSKQAMPVEVSNSSSMKGLVQPSPYSDVVYDLKPNLQGRFQGKPLRINSLGMRDREYSLDKPADTIRIVGLGDSVMFGWGVAEEDSYLRRIEQELNQRAPTGKKVEVLNFAVPGYNTAMEVAAFEHKAVLFKPDLVVIHFVRNDTEVPLFMLRPKNVFSLRSSFLLQFLKQTLRAVLQKKHSPLLDAALKGLRRDDRAEVLAQYRYMLGEHGYREAIARLGRLCKERNIPVVMLLSSASSRMKQVIRDDIVKEWGFHYVELKPYVDAYAKEHNIPDSTKARDKAFRLSPTDHHPNSLGHQIYAQALFEKLNDLKLFGENKSD